MAGRNVTTVSRGRLLTIDVEHARLNIENGRDENLAHLIRLPLRLANKSPSLNNFVGDQSRVWEGSSAPRDDGK